MKNIGTDRLVRTAGFLFVFIFLCSWVAAVSAEPARDIEADVDAFMGYLAENLDVVPGYSVAVVTADATILAKGYGTTIATGGQPMDADTQVYIASSTKSLTALAVASLASQGLLDMDTPIKKYIPELVGSAAGEVTLRQLLSHTHGLEEDALTWRTAYSGQYTPAILLEIVRNMPLSENPGIFNYSNTGYVIASLVLERHFGESWKRIIEKEVLIPAGMNSTTAFVSALELDYARPHSWFGTKNAFPLPKQDNTMHAAGGHFSTANDMARWLQAQLSDGKINGQQVFPRGVVASTHVSNTPLEADFFTYQRHHYGLGWYQADYREQQMFHHFGSYSGYRAHVSFIPALGVGVAVLINDASRPGFNLPDLIANYVYDLVAGEENPDAEAKQNIAKLVEMIQPIAGSSPPDRPRNAPEDEIRYMGRYHNEDFGTINFLMTEGELTAVFGNLSSRTTYKKDGALRMELTPYDGTLGRFVESENGEVSGFLYQDALFSLQ